MTIRRWIALCCTALALALPAAASPVPAAPAGEPYPVESSYAAIFAPTPEVGEAAPTPAAPALVFCCSTTYCCERVPSAECDGIKFNLGIQCFMQCSLC